MRILMQTGDPAAEQSYRQAAEALNRQRLYVLHSEAQVLERLFRDRFDALIVDDADTERTWLRNAAPQNASNLILLLRDPMRLGCLPDSVTYGFARSYEPIEVLRRIDSFPCAKPETERTEAVVSRTLQRVGVTVHLKGFSVLKEAIRILLWADRPTEIRLIDDVYPAIAGQMHCSIAVVEHAMRHAIEAAWLRADVRELEALFGDTVSAERAAPSNAGFLYLISDRIRTEQRRTAV
mgnify:CR=1 FL=1